MTWHFEHVGLKSSLLTALMLLFSAPGARALENCTCRLDDNGCRPNASLMPNAQRTQLGLRWTYSRDRCHDRYIIRFGVIGHDLEQRDIEDAPFPCRATDNLGNTNCGYGFNFNKDKPYIAMVEACTHSVFEGSSCTGWSAAAFWLPYGPDTCKDGFVWRDAFANDHVCVVPQLRDMAAAENRDAGQHVQPGGGAYGPDTCKSGFVWREADRVGNTQGKDHVCVVPQRRAEVWAENAAAAGNKARP